MDRPIVYPGQVPADTDFLTTAMATLRAFNGVLAATFGSSTLIDGLVVSPGTGLEVVVGPGSILASGIADTTAYGSLGTASDTIVKQGIINSSTTLGPFTAPTTSGQSVNILIQAALSEVDTNPALLLYYNANNPGTPYGGSNNSGVTQPTLRRETVALSSVAGAAAATGAQTTPSASAGCVPVAVVTIACGQTSITTANIVTSNTNQILSKLGSVLQAGGSVSDYSSRLVTSAWAQALLATETARAESVEAQLTPIGAFTASLVLNGYRIDECSSSPTGRIITQWGTNGVGASSPIYFPTTFPHAALGMVVSESNATAATWGDGKPTVHGYQNLWQGGYTAWAESWTGSSWQGGTISQSYIVVGY